MLPRYIMAAIKPHDTEDSIISVTHNTHLLTDPELCKRLFFRDVIGYMALQGFNIECFPSQATMFLDLKPSLPSSLAA